MVWEAARIRYGGYTLIIIAGGAIALGLSLAGEEGTAFTFGILFFMITFAVAAILTGLNNRLKMALAKD